MISTKKKLIAFLVILGLAGLAVGIWILFDKGIIGSKNSDQTELLTCNNCQQKYCKNELEQVIAIEIDPTASIEDMISVSNAYNKCICKNCKNVCTDLNQPNSISSESCNNI